MKHSKIEYFLPLEPVGPSINLFSIISRCTARHLLRGGHSLLQRCNLTYFSRYQVKRLFQAKGPPIAGTGVDRMVRRFSEEATNATNRLLGMLAIIKYQDMYRYQLTSYAAR